MYLKFAGESGVCLDLSRVSTVGTCSYQHRAFSDKKSQDDYDHHESGRAWEAQRIPKPLSKYLV